MKAFNLSNVSGKKIDVDLEESFPEQRNETFVSKQEVQDSYCFSFFYAEANYGFFMDVLFVQSIIIWLSMLKKARFSTSARI